jgi:hypothetical protein
MMSGKIEGWFSRIKYLNKACDIRQERIKTKNEYLKYSFP